MLIGNATNNITLGVNSLSALQGRRAGLEAILTDAVANGRPEPPGVVAEVARVSAAIASTNTSINTANQDAKQGLQIIDSFTKIGDAVQPR